MRLYSGYNTVATFPENEMRPCLYWQRPGKKEADRRNNRTDHSGADAAEDIYLIQFSVNQNGELYRIKHLLSKSWKVLCHGIYQWRFECGAWNVAQSDTYTTRVP